MQITYNWDDFLIIGDSFCARRDKEYSWPQLVLTHFTNSKFNKRVQPRGRGFQGGAWWSYRNVLLEELAIKVPKVLIVCHTEPYRLPNDNNYGLNFRSVETRLLDVDNKERVMPKAMAKAAELYYKELMCFDFYDWANRQWFIELDSLCQNRGIEKVIHMFCFSGDYTEYTFNKGVTIDIPLHTYAEEPKTYFWNFKSVTVNHFTPEGNKLFANKLIELITEYPGDNIRVSTKMVNYENN